LRDKVPSPQVKDAIIKILNKAGINYKLLKEGVCCSDLLFRLRQKREAKSTAEKGNPLGMTEHIKVSSTFIS